MGYSHWTSIFQNENCWLFLRGNANGKDGITQDNPLNILQKGVISRSVIDATVPE